MVYFSYTLLFKEIRILGIILISPHNTTRLIPDLYLTNTLASMLIPLTAKQLKLSQRTSFFSAAVPLTAEPEKLSEVMHSEVCDNFGHTA